MKRVYITGTEDFDNVRVLCVADTVEEIPSIPIPEDISEWICHYAESPEQAICQHFSKHDEWSEDMQSGKPEKKVY